MRRDELLMFAIGAVLVLGAILYSRRSRATYVPVGYSGKNLAELYL